MITLIGSTDAEIQAVHQKDIMLAARTPLLSLRPQRPSTVTTSSSNTRRFSRFDTLPYPSAERALQLLHRLADDRGIRGIMLQRAWNVGLLHELCPRQRPDILGYNQNAGQSIALRLRTDDLTGFRHYESVRKVLLHELAHMVHGEHDHRFWALYRELERDVVRLDWSAHGGRLLTSAAGGDFYQSQEGQEDLDDTARRTTFTGGVYRLGTLASAERQQATPMRQLLADAAILRLTAEERAMAEACGSGGHGHAHGGASSTDELSKDNPSTDETQQQNH